MALVNIDAGQIDDGQIPNPVGGGTVARDTALYLLWYSIETRNSPTATVHTNGKKIAIGKAALRKAILDPARAQYEELAKKAPGGTVATAVSQVEADAATAAPDDGPIDVTPDAP